MFCPFCKAIETKVIDSRLVEETNQVRRRRECLECTQRFTTYELAEISYPRIVKRDGSRNEFDELKLRRGLNRALEKRPVSAENIEIVVAHIKQKLMSSPEREIASEQLGQWVMEELHKIDQVAYVRFASVYRDFQDVDEFRKEIDRLLKKDGKKSKSPNKP